MGGLPLAVVDHPPALHVLGDEGVGVGVAGLGHRGHLARVDGGRCSGRMPWGQAPRIHPGSTLADMSLRYGHEKATKIIGSLTSGADLQARVEAAYTPLSAA